MQSLRRGSAAGRTVASHSRNPHLNTYVSEAFAHPVFCIFNHLWNFGAIDVCIGVGGLPALSTGKLIHRHACLAAFDVPKRLIDPAEGVVQYRAIFPIRAVIAGLPDVLDPVRRLVQKERLQILFDRGLDEISTLRKSSATVAVEPVLVGSDLHDREPNAFWLAFNYADVSNSRHRH